VFVFESRKKVLGVSPLIRKGRDEARTAAGKDVLSVGLISFPDKKPILNRKNKALFLRNEEER
jgi:hypothetical protein